MNLIKENWLPVIRRDGTQEMIAPYAIASNYETNPVIDFCSPRPDFQGSLYQLLIGLLQTARILDNEEHLKQLLKEPFSIDQLQKQLEFLIPYFEFEKGDALFLQDLHLPECTPNSIASLLIDSPGDNAVKQNKDLFVKRDRVDAICPQCCAVALFTMQSSAPAGGAGFRTSMRGGGPLNTLVKIEPVSTNPTESGIVTLWQNLIINVIPNDLLEQKLTTGDWKLEQPEFIFPWLKETTTSEAKTGRATRPDDIHPFQMYWGMPRRIRINFDSRKEGNCDLCGTIHDQLITQCFQKNYGINYDGAFFHPFSPYLIKGDTPTAMHAQPGGIGYQHFPGIGIKDPESNIEKAWVVQNCAGYSNLDEYKNRLRIWVFGYDMDNMKARNWYEAKMPLFNFGKIDEDEFFLEAKQLIKAASDMLFQLRSRVQDACFEPSDKRRNDLYKKSFWIQIQLEYWKKTEIDFYQKVEELYSLLSENEKDDYEEIKTTWYLFLMQLCFDLFEQSMLSGEFEQGNAKRVIKAQIMLHNVLKSKKFKEKCIE